MNWSLPLASVLVYQVVLSWGVIWPSPPRGHLTMSEIFLLVPTGKVQKQCGEKRPGMVVSILLFTGHCIPLQSIIQP